MSTTPTPVLSFEERKRRAEAAKVYEKAIVANTPSPPVRPTDKVTTVAGIDKHEAIVDFLLYGKDFRCIVLQSQGEYDAGRIVFTRPRKDRRQWQLCSFGFKYVTTPTRGYMLIRDTLMQNDEVVYPTAVDLLHRIRKILGIRRSDALQFTTSTYVQEILEADLNHQGYMNFLAKFQPLFVQLKALEKQLRKPGLNPAWKAQMQSKVDDELEPKMKALVKEYKTNITSFQTSHDGLPVTGKVTPSGDADFIHTEPKVFDSDSERILRQLIMGRQRADDNVMDASTKIKVDQSLKELVKADVVSQIATHMDRLIDPDSDDFVGVRVIPVSNVINLQYAMRTEHKTVATQQILAEAPIGIDIDKELTQRMVRDMINANTETVEAKLKQLADRLPRENLCVVWVDEHSYSAAVDCVNMTLMYHTNEASVHGGSAKNKLVFSHDAVADFLNGWTVLSSPERPLNTSSLSTLSADLIQRFGVKTVQSALRDQAAHGSKLLGTQKQTPLVTGLRSLMRGVREEDVFGFLMRQKLDNRCVTVPTASPDLFFIYWSMRSMKRDARVVVRESVHIREFGAQGWMYVFNQYREDRRLLTLDDGEVAQRKIAQRMAGSNLVMEGIELADEDLDEARSEEGVRDLSRFVISDSFTYRLRRWKADDESDLYNGKIFKPKPPAAPGAPRDHDADFEKASVFSSLVGLLQNAPLLQPMQDDHKVQQWQKFQKDMQRDFRNRLQGMSL